MATKIETMEAAIAKREAELRKMRQALRNDKRKAERAARDKARKEAAEAEAKQMAEDAANWRDVMVWAATKEVTGSDGRKTMLADELLRGVARYRARKAAETEAAASSESAAAAGEAKPGAAAPKDTGAVY